MTNVAIGNSAQSYGISLARPEDEGQIRNFIQTYWKSGHALSESGELLRWNHLDVTRGRLNFAIARVNGEIAGILGFIPTSHFDAAEPYAQDLWIVLWKVREELQLPGLGLLLFRYLLKELSPQRAYSIGFNDHVAPFPRALGFELFDLKHFYRIHGGKEEFSLLSGEIKRTACISSKSITVRGASELLTEFRAVVEATGHHPHKTIEYLLNRFVRHPFYRYDLTGVWRDGTPVALLVSRIAEAKGAKAVRIVDLFGTDDDLRYIGPAIDSLIEQADAEYADFYCHGYDSASLEAAGLLLKTNDVIVPNFFEPFVASNVRVRCAVKHRATGGIRIVRADSDQDRPSLLPYSK